MKLIFLLILFYSIISEASNKYYIVEDDASGSLVVIGRNTLPETYLFTVPKDDDGKFVQTMDDVTILTVASEACIPVVNCSEKLQTICMEISEDGTESKIPNSRPVAGAVSVSCAVASFDSDKRVVRLQVLEDHRQTQQEKRGVAQTRLNSIRNQCASANGLLKLLCEHVSEL